MAAAVFYLAYTPARDRHPVTLPNGATVYIRADVVAGASVEEMLDDAAPRPGEHVMNSHDVPEGR